MARNLSIESLRVFLMFLIVTLHLSARVYDIESSGNVFTLALLHGIRSVCILGVSTFAFISGYYGVKFNLQKFLRYELMALFWGVVFCCIGILYGEFNYRMLFPTASGELWYFSAYMILMLLSPFLNAGISLMTKKQFTLVLALLFIVVYGGQFILRYGVGHDFLVIITIYLIGQYLHKYPIEYLERRTYRFTGICLALHVVTTTFVSAYMLNKFNSWGGGTFDAEQS